MSDINVRVAAADACYYPHVFVTCDGRDLDPYVKQHPRVVVEALSWPTEGIDRREKLINYRKLDSLHEYVLTSSNQRQVEVYRREADGG